MRIPCRADFMYRLLFEIVFSKTLFESFTYLKVAKIHSLVTIYVIYSWIGVIIVPWRAHVRLRGFCK